MPSSSATDLLGNHFADLGRDSLVLLPAFLLWHLVTFLDRVMPALLVVHVPTRFIFVCAALLPHDGMALFFVLGLALFHVHSLANIFILIDILYNVCIM